MSQPFRERLVAALPALPADLKSQLQEFVIFDRDSLAGLDVGAVELLAEQGMPRNASPFLSFSSYAPEQIDNLRQAGAIPKGFFPFGQNGSGDLLGIDTSTNEVFYLNHDRHNERVFVNSTLGSFAESLCLFQEHLTAKTIELCLQAIDGIDPPAAKPGTMWHAEVFLGL